MRALLTAAVVTAYCLPQVNAENGAIPTCARACVSQGEQSTLCGLSNTTCTCADPKFQANITACLTINCSLKEALAMRNLTSATCHEPIRDRSRITPIITTIFGGLAIIATIMRGFQFPAHFDIEDVCAILGLLTAVPMGALEYPMSAYGFGKDIWTVPFDDVTQIVKVTEEYTWLTQLLYIASLSCVKMAFLFLCWHVFPKEGLRRIIYILMGFVSAYCIVYLFGLVFECLPISYIWTQWTGETTGHCLKFNAFGWSCAIWNIILDLAIMFVPLYEIKKLSLSGTKKALVMSMFGAGFFVTIVSTIRLKAIITFANTANPTYDNVPTAYWSIIECYSAIICLNMPAIRHFCRSCISVCLSSTSTSHPDCNTVVPVQSLAKAPSTSRIIVGMISTKQNHNSDAEDIELLDARTPNAEGVTSITGH